MEAGAVNRGEGRDALAFAFAGAAALLWLLPTTRLLDLKLTAGLLAGAVLALGLGRRIWDGRPLGAPRPALWGICAAAALAFTLAWLASPMRSLAGERGVALAAALFLAVGTALLPRHGTAPLLEAWRWSLVLLSLYALAQRLGLEPLAAYRSLSRDRAMASFGNPGALAAFLVLSWPLLLDWQGRRRALALGLAAAALLATQSRAGLLAAWAQLAWLGWRAWRDGARPRRRHFVLLAAGLAALLAAMPPAAWLRPSLRLPLWASALELWRARPWLGWGPGSFVLLAPDYLLPSLQVALAASGQVAEDPHNLGLLLLCEGGLLGLGAFLAAAWVALRAAGRGGALGRAGALGGAGLLLASSVDRFFFLPGVLLPAGLALGLALRSDEECKVKRVWLLPLGLLALGLTAAAWRPLRAWQVAVGANLADGLQAAGEPETLRRAAELSREPGDWDRAGLAYAASGAHAAAADCFRRGLALRPESGRAQNLGNSLFLLGDLVGAENAYRWAVRLDPRSADARFSLGYALWQQRRLAEAAAELDAALRLEPGHPGALKLKEQLLH